MENGICLNAMMPVRAEPSEKSEMVSQLLFGETYRVAEKSGKWYRIVCFHDEYSGWVSENIHTPLAVAGKEAHLAGTQTSVIANAMSLIKQDGTEMLIYPGSSLPKIISGQRTFTIERVPFLLKNDPETIIAKPSAVNICQTAMHFCNAPYLWGGRSLFGIDCSGLIQVVFKINQIALPRNAGDQEQAGEPVGLDGCRPADVAFFKNEQGKIVHAGIMLSPDKIIHASGRVKVDRLDNKGIIDTATGIYSHQLSCVKRYTGNYPGNQRIRFAPSPGSAR